MKRLEVLGIALLAALPAMAQTTTPSTCTTAPASFTAFNIERTLTLANAGLFTTATPSVPPAVLAALASGALELRESARLDTGTNVLTIQDFTAQPGTPSPTAPNTIQSSSVLSISRIQVENVYFTCQPVPAGLIVGRVLTNFPVTPFGNATGSLAAVGFGYTTDNPPKINNVTLLIPGVAGLFTQSAVGTLTFPTSTVTPPGTAGKPVIVFTPGQTQSWAQKQIILDASKSTDPNGLQLTYSWRQVNTNIAAGINNGNTATPLITFGGGKGDYTFEVTVTNSQGVQSTAQTTISYTGT